jgi:ComF family protein
MPFVGTILKRCVVAARWLLAAVSTGLLDLLSTPRCAACDQALGRKSVFCPACATSIVRATPPRRAITACGGTDAGASDEGIVVHGFAQYGGAVADALRRLKYGDRPDLAHPLGALLRRATRQARATAQDDAVPLEDGSLNDGRLNFGPLDCDLVVPVPLHPRRLAERGYNQAALLARQVQPELGAPLSTSMLLRVIDTPAQAKLSRTARAQNLRGAFVVVRPERLRDKRVVLVDDIATTGATLAACATALRHAGAASVAALVVALADRRDGR